MLKLFSTLLSLYLIISPIEMAFAQSAGSSPTVESISGASGNLTDQQAYDASRFNHTGYRSRMIEKLCEEKEGEGIENCEELFQVDKTGFVDIMHKNMGKAYAMIFGGLAFMGGGGMPQIATGLQGNTDGTTQGSGKYLDAKGKPTADADKAAKEKQTDFCMVGAIGWEMVAMLMQNQLNQNTEQATAGIKNEQERALVALKRNHEDRANTSLVQAVAYGVITVCYAVYGFAGAFSHDTGMTWVKLGAAALIAFLYGVKYNHHINAAAAVDHIIKGLPRDGACNPYTQTDCFCKEKTSRELFASEYQQVCVVNRPLWDPPTSLGCGVKINNEISYDKECKCRQTNTCFNTQIQGFDPKFKLANNVMNMANKGADLLASGEFEPAKLVDFATTSTAFGLKAARSNKNRKMIRTRLNPETAAAASELAKIFPPDVAAAIAAAPEGKPPAGLGMSGGPATASLDKLPSDLKKKVAEAIKTNYNTNSAGNSSSSNDSAEPQFQLPSFGKKTDANGNEVVKFAEKAFNNADITKAKDVPIFDIISNRYRRSGWNKVESPELKTQ